ncbi:monovalent cation/H(+) antiporter subunit G [Salinibacterium sp. PAMC 21357]|uniref:monovalent cation/H(+) antiporter subunit G n=1 Tax=Salinibacterium sp. PAMC 21357 TaxID=1112215 RepID=UPI0002881374|nr:monovalent cation/H(+) antiporter subunit G [Salinibacterium sp. PAMC 21357]
MSFDLIADILTSVFLLLGAFLSLAAGVGLIRFPDAIARMHATTKPQILGLTFILAGIALEERQLSTTLVLMALLAFQMMTAPISAHMIGRAGYRNDVIAPGSLLVDELKQSIDEVQQELGRAENEPKNENDDGSPN